MIDFPVDELRRQFPALDAADGFLFFDNAAGAQAPSCVLAATADHLLRRNVQRGGPYRRSQEVDETIARARAAVAALVNARAPEEIAFGLNATSFIRSVSLAIARSMGGRSEIVVTDLDHEANIAAWIALEQYGARLVWWRVRDDGRLHVADLAGLLSERTRLVACTVASNATGSRVDVAAVAEAAHAAGAEVFLDAVHFGPHGLIDVRAMDCDYLVCSGYKIFSPHMGFAFCRAEAVNRLPTFREDFIPDVMPDKLEAGTYAYESVAGMEAAVGYLEQVGHRVGVDANGSRRDAVCRAMEAVAAYERTLSAALLDAVRSVDGAAVHGLTDARRLDARVPTVSFTVDGLPASRIAVGLAGRDVGVRSGHMYSPRLMRRLGLMPEGTVRVSLVHYNTAGEIERFREALAATVAELRS